MEHDAQPAETSSDTIAQQAIEFARTNPSELKDMKQLADVAEALRNLAQKEPGRVEWLRRLCAVLGEAADRLYAANDKRGAVSALHSKLTSLEELLAKDPSNLDWLWDRASTRSRWGYIIAELGSFDDAVKVQALAAEGLEAMATAYTQRAEEARYFLYRAHETIGLVRQYQQDYASAQKALEANLEARSRFAVYEGRPHHHCQAAKVQVRIAQLQAAQNDIDGARKTLSVAFESIDATAKGTEASVWIEAGLPDTQVQIGRGMLALGNDRNAFAAYQSAKEILEPAGTNSPLPHLITMYECLSFMAAIQKRHQDSDGAQQSRAAAGAVLNELQSRQPTPQEQERLAVELRDIHDRLAPLL